MKVSVCIATYNGSRYIQAQLGSILAQLSEIDEVIIVDDNSLDNTVEIISTYNDNRVMLVKNECNMGVTFTFEKAMRMATGDLIFLSDQDDIWFDDKVNIVKDIFATQEVDLLVHDAVVVRDDKVIFQSLFHSRNSSSGVIKNILSNTYTGCCMAFRPNLLKKILPIPLSRQIFHDAWIGILANYYKFDVLFYGKPLIRFIRHDNNSSTLQRRHIKDILTERFVFTFAFVKRIFQNKLHMGSIQTKNRMFF